MKYRIKYAAAGLAVFLAQPAFADCDNGTVSDGKEINGQICINGQWQGRATGEGGPSAPTTSGGSSSDSGGASSSGGSGDSGGASGGGEGGGATSSGGKSSTGAGSVSGGPASPRVSEKREREQE